MKPRQKWMPKTPQSLLFEADSPVIALFIIITTILVIVFAFALHKLPGNGFQSQTLLPRLRLHQKHGALGAATEGGQRLQAGEIEHGNIAMVVVVVVVVNHNENGTKRNKRGVRRWRERLWETFIPNARRIWRELSCWRSIHLFKERWELVEK